MSTGQRVNTSVVAFPAAARDLSLSLTDCTHLADTLIRHAPAVATHEDDESLEHLDSIELVRLQLKLERRGVRGVRAAELKHARASDVKRLTEGGASAVLFGGIADGDAGMRDLDATWAARVSGRIVDDPTGLRAQFLTTTARHLVAIRGITTMPTVTAGHSIGFAAAALLSKGTLRSDADAVRAFDVLADTWLRIADVLEATAYDRVNVLILDAYDANDGCWDDTELTVVNSPTMHVRACRDGVATCAMDRGIACTTMSIPYPIHSSELRAVEDAVIVPQAFRDLFAGASECMVVDSATGTLRQHAVDATDVVHAVLSAPIDWPAVLHTVSGVVGASGHVVFADALAFTLSSWFPWTAGVSRCVDTVPRV